jgi:phosphatidylglycerophosphate synthase
MKKPITLADVRSSFNYSYPANYTMRWFGRPLADRLTPMMVNAGITANGVTVFRSYLSLIGVGILLMPFTFWPPVVAVTIFYFSFILDCVDGNIARINEETSYLGKFMDGLSDYIFILGAPGTVGIALSLNSGEWWPVAVGSSATIACLLSQMARSRLSFMREWMVGNTGPLSAEQIEGVAGLRRLQAIIDEFSMTGTFFAPLLLLVPGTDGMEWFVWSQVAVLTIPETLWFLTTLREAGVLLNRHRVSKHAPESK